MKCKDCVHYKLCRDLFCQVDTLNDDDKKCDYFEQKRPHGEWIPINIHEETWDYKCSVCGAEVDIDFPNCPYCLADMQKKEGEEK